MAEIQEQIKRINACIVKDDPWASGTLDVPENFLKLYYSEKTPNPSHCAVSITLDKSTSPDALARLETVCEPATFGRGKEDVLDETYRKAGKMNTTSFSSPFNIHESRILDLIMPGLFRGPDADRAVLAELYKLNIYGPGSFFRSHKDTPRSNDMFGSLVIVFPTTHEGGSLALRHDKKEFMFDSSQLVSGCTNRIAYAAFFSDVEHEVLPVTEGYRVTLTYNLYHTRPSGIGLNAAAMNEIIALKNNVSALLEIPTFLSDGGILGFGLRFSYPVKILDPEELDEPNDSFEQPTFDESIPHLKGSDELIKIACTELGLRVHLKGIVATERLHENRHIMISRPCGDLGYNEEYSSLSDELFENGDAELIHGDEGIEEAYADTDDHAGKMSKQVVWITKSAEEDSQSTSDCRLRSSFVAFGNDAAVNTYYAEVCLMAFIGPAGERKSADEYEGLEVQ